MIIDLGLHLRLESNNVDTVALFSGNELSQVNRKPERIIQKEGRLTGQRPVALGELVVQVSEAPLKGLFSVASSSSRTLTTRSNSLRSSG